MLITQLVTSLRGLPPLALIACILCINYGGKRRSKVSPVVQSSDPVHQSSPVITDSPKGLGLQRDDGSGSLIPTNRMPMGLLEYVINFYQSSKVIILIVNCVLSLL